MPVAFLQPSGFSQALRLKAQWGTDAYPVVGGTDLMVKMRAGKMAPRAILDLGRVPLGYIRRGREWVRLGASVTAGDLLRTPWIHKQAPALVKACMLLGGPQIQNGATLGGNLANASPAADTPPVLMAMDAEVCLESRERGARWVAVRDFPTGPGRSVLAADELIREFRVPRASFDTRRGADATRVVSDFFKMGARRAQVISVCAVAAWARIRGGGASNEPLEIVEARLAAGSVAPRVVRLDNVEALLRGRVLDPALIDEAVAAVRADISPISDVRGSADYKALLARNFTRDFLESLK